MLFIIFKVREIEESISIPGIKGEMKYLPRIKRLYPWVTKDVIIVDDGFVKKLYF
jgi:hypothetical protein